MSVYVYHTQLYQEQNVKFVTTKKVKKEDSQNTKLFHY